MARTASDGAWYGTGELPRPVPAKRWSQYLVMRDGVRLAIDVTHPASSGRFPAIVRMTRYHRRLALTPLGRALGLESQVDFYQRRRRFFLSSGYAWIDVCVRGCGASGGRQVGPWSADDEGDARELVDWIVAQPWSSRLVGAMGVSYDGTCAELIGWQHHPAVRAVAPMFCPFDLYADASHPGGVYLEWFLRRWGEVSHLLDENDSASAMMLLTGLSMTASADALGIPRRPWDAIGSWLSRGVPRALARTVFAGLVRGVARVDEDRDGALLRECLAQREDRFDVYEATSRIVYRDDPGASPLTPELTIDDFSPHSRAHDLASSDAAVYSYGGLCDGAFTRSAVRRFQALREGRRRLLLGPWPHWGGQNVSPHSGARKSAFDHDAELLRFFDHHLRGGHETFANESPVWYFTSGEERWKSSEDWPPAGTRNTQLYLQPNGGLRDRAPLQATHVHFEPRADHCSGRSSRWRLLLNLQAPVVYDTRRIRASLDYTTEPFSRAVELTGEPQLFLRLAQRPEPTAVSVYLLCVEADGRVLYLTEGHASTRHLGTPDSGPSFTRAHADASRDDSAAGLCVSLLPMSYLVQRGQTLRLVVCGPDADHFDASQARSFGVTLGGQGASMLMLPFVESTTQPG